MNILLWVLQIVLAFLYLMGGGFKALHPDDPAKQIRAIPPAAWRALGVFEVLGAILLIVPGAANWMPALTPLAAALLAVETLAMAAVYSRYSLKLVPANPLVYAAPMGLLAVLVAYGRYSLGPSA
jgi:uncharacterized membrane protein YphA (DoxX/SURF4 family)